MKIYGLTDRGKIRKMNQDSFLIWNEGEQSLAVLCDGMGGAKSGNIASQMATEIFADSIKASKGKPIEILTEALSKANEEVLERSLNDFNCAGMGTTLVAAYLHKGKHFYIMNVGDSRAYLIQDSGISQVTRDHSFVADLVEHGKITVEEARNHPNKNIITRALGTEAHLKGDIFELDLNNGEYILLCSDGLSNVVYEQEMLYEVLYGENDENTCQRLVDIALERGAPDNVTVVLIAADTKNE